MKILFTGLPYFGKQLVAELNAFDRDNVYIFCDTYYSWKDRFKFLWHIRSADKVVSFNGVSSDSRALNWALRFKKPIIMQWHGSDVLTVRANKKSGKYTEKYIDAARQFTDAPWLQSELGELGIRASMLEFKHVKPAKDKKPFQSIGVMSYVAAKNESFYGFQHILELAKKYPKIPFHIVGTDGKGYASEPNVTFHGWVDDKKFNELLHQCPIFLRLTEHDGCSLSALKAIANGNYVLWNNPHPQAFYAPDPVHLPVQFSMLINQLMLTFFVRNQKGMEWAAEHLDKKKILEHYVKTILR